MDRLRVQENVLNIYSDQSMINRNEFLLVANVFIKHRGIANSATKRLCSMLFIMVKVNGQHLILPQTKHSNRKLITKNKRPA